jgi:hypothetical protein
VILDKNSFSVFKKIEDLKSILINDDRKISFQEFGAYSEKKSSVFANYHQVKKVKSIAKKSATRAEYG